MERNYKEIGKEILQNHKNLDTLFGMRFEDKFDLNGISIEDSVNIFFEYSDFNLNEKKISFLKRLFLKLKTFCMRT